MELIKVENGVHVLNDFTSKQLASLEMQMKDIKEVYDGIKAEIMREMEEQNIIKIDTPDLTVSYVQASDRETFDTAKFKKEHSDLYDDYVKLSPVKPSVRIKVKTNE